MNIFTRPILALSLSAFVLFSLLFSTNGNLVFANVKTGIDIGQKAPVFKLLTINDKELELEFFSKDKVTLLVFSALHAGMKYQSLRNITMSLKIKVLIY